MQRRTFLATGLPILARAQVQEDTWQQVTRVVAVGDVHGDKDALAATLRMAGLIDENEHWTGGSAHLVQVGDIPSRGPQSRKAFDLLMRLETEAREAGGRVHSLIGNHDAGVIYGDLRSVLPEEYAEFRTPQSEELLEKAYSQELLRLKKANRLPRSKRERDFHRTRWFEQRPPGFVEHRRAFAPDGPYGRWIRGNNAVVKINDTLFVHGGISPKYATTAIGELNARIRHELANPAELIPGLCTELQGPLWYRGLAEGEEQEIRTHVEAVLRFHGVARVVVGHTVTRTAILPRCQSRVVNVDLGLSRFYGRPPACMVIDSSGEYVLHRNARVPVPPVGSSASQMVEYLRLVERADEQPSPVKKLLEEFAAG